METILAFTLMQRCLLNEDLINCVWSFEIEQISIAIDILSDRISSSKRHRNYSESIFCETNFKHQTIHSFYSERFLKREWITSTPIENSSDLFVDT